MSVTSQEHEVVQGMFDAMQMGLSGEDKMLSLFAEDAKMTEPFDMGKPTTTEGKEAIRKRFVGMWSGEGPHDLSLTIDQIDASDGNLKVQWTCRSAAFLTPMFGVDYFTVQDGLIQELVMEVTTWPDFAGGEAHA